ncbi:MAG: hypothetical protein J07HQW2_02811 [Haloquadratum walsbyi J07HQW2]|uniref:DUF8081 domain-containing protein n=1 Tax=Haloquadratum walsbyi J07HQW2 TaxID=1238425 RepID=U1N0K7_9EURY|nr:MAG: hypothetical protein J07HQW2_02811 [Haloquadratum walsbyi J07HQW2]
MYIYLYIVSKFLVDIKSSARRTNGSVGEIIRDQGSRHQFDSREDAEEWAAELATRGSATVWIRRANPSDSSDIDAYLLGRYTPSPLSSRGQTQSRVTPESKVRIISTSDDYDNNDETEQYTLSMKQSE